MAEYKLTFSDTAFNAGDVSGITKTWKLFTPEVKSANDTDRKSVV